MKYKDILEMEILLMNCYEILKHIESEQKRGCNSNIFIQHFLDKKEQGVPQF